MCAIVANNNARVGVVCDATPSLFAALSPRLTQIAIGEIFAVILAFKFASEAFRECSSISFIDNMGVLHTIVNGTSPQLDLGAFAQGLHFKLAQLNAVVWWEYVPSPSNIADGGPRKEDVNCPLAAAAGIKHRVLRCDQLEDIAKRIHYDFRMSLQRVRLSGSSTQT